MNEAIALPPGLGTVKVGELFPLPTVPSEMAARRLSARADELIRNIASVLDELVVCMLEKRTASEFRELRDDVFPKYFDCVRALSDLISVVVPRHVRTQVANESFCELEADFRNQGSAAFGVEVRDQAIFTIWTLRKISNICLRIDEAKVAIKDKKADLEFATQFAFYTLWTRFHLDCLTKSMQVRNAMYPEVLEVVIDGLRAAVNAYAWARRGLVLRMPEVGQPAEQVEWDDEDQALLDEATRDSLNEPV